MRKNFTNVFLCTLCFLLFTVQVSFAQTISGLAPVTYTEGSAPVLLQPNISVTGGSNFGGGSLLFKLSSPNIGDQMSLFNDVNPNASGSISVSNNGVFLGTGSGTQLVGSIDGVLNGQNGKDLKINFASNFSNSSFESGIDGWTVGTQFVNLGATVIAGYTSPNDLTDALKSGGDNSPPTSNARYYYELSTTQFTQGAQSLRLYSQMTTSAGYDVVHGPYVYSAPFQSNAGDVLSFDWRAFAGADAYDVFGYILNVNTGATTIVLNQTGSTTSSTPWATASVTVPTTGSYRFVFVSGTYDASGGRAAGASLYIDNVRVFGNNVDAAIITNIANNILYQNTCGTTSASRNLQISITKLDNTTTSAQTTVALNTFAPVANCQNTSLSLNALGVATLSPASLNAGSTDNCAMTFAVDKSSFDCSNIGENPVLLSVTDSYGNTSTCSATVTVVDNYAPVPNVATLPTVSDNCSVSLTPPTAKDNCGTITATTTDPTTYNKQGTYTVNWTYDDGHGNTTTQTQTVVVKDIVPPAITCPANIEVNATSAAGAVVTYTAPTGTDNCSATTTRTAGLASGDVFPIGTTTVTHTVTDEGGNSRSCSFTVTVKGVAPVIVCPENIVVNSLENQCGATANFAATETTGIPASTITYSINPGSFFGKGLTQVTATATNLAGSSSCTFTVEVKDATSPSIVNLPVSKTVPNDKGLCGAVVSWVAPTASDNCPGASIVQTAGPASGSLFPTGTTTVSYKATDAVGNTVEKSFAITVEDKEPPTISCSFDITVNADANSCGAVVNYSAPSASDNCGTGSLPTSLPGYTYKGTFGGHTYFLSNAVATPENAHAAAVALGGHLVTISSAAENSFVSAMNPNFIWIGFTDRDIEGSFKWVTSEPVGYTNWNNGEPNNYDGNEDWAVVNWGPNGTWNDWFYTATAFYVVEFDGGTVPTTLVSGPASGSAFPIGKTTVTYKATDAAGNISTCSFNVTVVDNQDPTIVGLPANVIKVNDAGVCGAVVRWTEPTSADNCTGHSISQIAGPANGSLFPVGITTVTYRAVDASGRTATKSFTVTVNDVEKPTIVNLPLNIVQGVDAGNCNAVVKWNTPAAADNCTGATLLQTAGPVSGSVFPLGTTTITYQAKDAKGNTTMESFTVTVKDNQPPVITCPGNIELIATSAAGAVATYTAPVGADNCSGATTERTAGLASGAMFPIGTTTVTHTVTDGAGLKAECSFTVTVKGVAPQITCPENITVSTLSDQCGAPVSYTATDLVGIPASVITYSIEPGSFFSKGVTKVTAIATNAVGTSSCTFTVTVEDKTAPVVKTRSITVELNANGKVSITPAQVNDGSFDNCAVAADGYALSKSDFDCSNTGENTVMLTVTDESGNSSSKAATVTVVDNILPTVITQPVTIRLDANGKATVTPEQVNKGSFDNCGIVSLKLDKTDFTCENVGPNTVTLTVTDTKGNSDSKTSVVSVMDAINPTVLTRDISVQLNEQGVVSITPADINDGSFDNCKIASLTIDKASFTCSNVGANTVALTVKDVNGNEASANATVTVVDKVAPVVKTKGIVVRLSAAGQVSITTADVDAGTEDACGIKSLSLSKVDFDCSNVGENSVVLTAEDKNGNLASREAIVTVEDKTAPVVKTKNITVQLDANGKVSIMPSQINDGSADACGIPADGYNLDKADFNCSNVGANTVTLSVTDKNGNTASATAIVTVEDKVKPTVSTKNINVTLVGGVAKITPAMIDNGSFDACGISSLVLDKTSFTCNNLGANTVTLTVTDKNNNTDSKTAIVTVIGVIPAPAISVSRSNTTYTGVGSEKTIFLGYGAQSLNLAASNGTSSQASTQYSWSPASFLNATQGATVTYAPDASAVPGTIITVTATNEYGCIKSENVAIKVVDARCGPDLKKVQICHVGHGNLLHENTICIDASAVDVHLKAGCTLGQCSQVTTRIVSAFDRTAPAKAFTINVAPNPTTNKFRIAVEGSDSKKAMLKVYDVKGRLLETRNNIPINSVVEVGANYRSGVYIAEVTQGTERRQLRLVKIAD